MSLQSRTCWTLARDRRLSYAAAAAFVFAYRAEMAGLLRPHAPTIACTSFQDEEFSSRSDVADTV